VLAFCSYPEFVNIKIWEYGIFYSCTFVVVIFIIIAILSMNSDNVTLTSLPRLHIRGLEL